jgi:DNA (cytosine-5)-methyltransferase 1
MNFYEFFAGAGMARAGLGANWRCLFANDIDPKKGAPYAANWGGQGLVVDDVGALRRPIFPASPISPGRRRPASARPWPGGARA